MHLLAWVSWVVSLRGWHASIGNMDGMTCKHGWCACVGSVPAWVAS